MNSDFAGTITTKSRAEFRNYYMRHNLRSIRKLCLIFFILNLLFRIFLSIVPDAFTRAHNFPEFNLTIWIHLAVTPILYFITDKLYKNINKTRKATKGTTVAIMVISLYIICSGMVSSFIVTYIPSDNLIGFMVALTVVSVICVFELEQTLFITLLTGILFAIMLLALSNSHTEILYNALICSVLLTGFFFISRYNYTYKANHFLQLVEINKKNREIEQASNFKTEVLGMVAHDLRNPIAAIESLAMLMELDTNDSDTIENINMVKQSCEKARSIIDDLLETARNENTDEIAVTRTEMCSFLRQLTNGWNHAASIPNRIVFNTTACDIYTDINVDKFQRVIDNLISNAAKFSKDTDTIDITLKADATDLQIEVRDHGVGIPNEILPHIFDRFSNARRSGLRGEQSTGLGLSIVKQIIEKHQGTIEVQSKVNEGSAFVIKLPININQ